MAASLGPPHLASITLAGIMRLRIASLLMFIIASMGMLAKHGLICLQYGVTSFSMVWIKAALA